MAEQMIWHCEQDEKSRSSLGELPDSLGGRRSSVGHILPPLRACYAQIDPLSHLDDLFDDSPRKAGTEKSKKSKKGSSGKSKPKPVPQPPSDTDEELFPTSRGMVSKSMSVSERVENSYLSQSYPCIFLSSIRLAQALNAVRQAKSTPFFPPDSDSEDSSQPSPAPGGLRGVLIAYAEYSRACQSWPAYK
eukprot:scaffold293549_cov36-Prasinocladus_malaysianus.AAC.1